MNLSLDQHELVRALESNRRLAIETIYKESLDKIYRYIFFKIYNEEDAEDITATVYLKLMKQLDKYEGEQSIGSWLYQIAKTEIINYWREKYKINDNFLRELFTYQEETHETSKETFKKIEKILLELPANYAKVLELRYLKGYSLEDCAKEMNTSVANVKVLQHRALKKAGGMTQ